MQEDRTSPRTYDAPSRAGDVVRFRSMRVDALDYEMARFRGGAVIPWADAETQAAIEAVV